MELLHEAKMMLELAISSLERAGYDTEDYQKTIYKIKKQYENETDIKVKKGEFYKYKEHFLSGQTKPALTIGKIYEIEKVRLNYRSLKIAVAIRDDNNVLRWYSFDSLKKRWEKI